MDDPGQDPVTDLEEMLERGRAVPRPAFRGGLRRNLLGKTPASRPAGLRRLIAGYATSAALLLIVAAAGLAGLGPLSA